MLDKDMLLRLFEQEIINQRNILALIAFACENPNISVDEIYSVVSIDKTIEHL